MVGFRQLPGSTWQAQICKQNEGKRVCTEMPEHSTRGHGSPHSHLPGLCLLMENRNLPGWHFPGNRGSLCLRKRGSTCPLIHTGTGMSRNATFTTKRRRQLWMLLFPPLDVHIWHARSFFFPLNKREAFSHLPVPV